MTDEAKKIQYNPFTDEKTETTLSPMDEVREYRNWLLSECDWTTLPDCKLSADKVTEWKTYRQTLRDLPANTADPKNPTFPTIPS
tara:strand:- start:19 stop:273 length:255 start_codon:yes stop_codon:yes gene_type:complete